MSAPHTALGARAGAAARAAARGGSSHAGRWPRLQLGRRAAAIAAVAAALLLAPHPGAARMPPPVLAAAAAPLRFVGEGEMRWFGLKLYDAALWSAAAPGQADGAEHALALRYARAFSAERLVATSIDEMRRLGERDEARLARWRARLVEALPAVAPGDTLVGLHRPGRGAAFWHDGRLTAEIDDPALARAFFAIWLDPRTRAPALRARLLGLDAGGR